MRQSSKAQSGRRAFLKRAAVVGGAATVAAAGGSAVAETGPDAPERDAATEARGKKGYHVTPHIERYYRSARM